jgi:hypothetical protein
LAEVVADLASVVLAQTDSQERTLIRLAESIGRDVGTLGAKIDSFALKLGGAIDDGAKTRAALRKLTAELRSEIIGVNDRLNDHTSEPATLAHAPRMQG